MASPTKSTPHCGSTLWTETGGLLSPGRARQLREVPGVDLEAPHGKLAEGLATTIVDNIAGSSW
ncbi:hypothetical protein DIJ64_09580 [Mycobacterium leprae]|uniref:Uncharacterized protein n=1 Tax=Mycobacterium leprae TaxID=1769 RepID=A0AAD2JDQ2_MYCLR|nr:hypothetical protein DIJ64_09580 [Mycobacterium leprae]OAR20852.1 hypothetical protein A8144_09240 [Mycobacterium leprae 3125609]OAX70957.1 hypothetical protein A3216_08690 [Mycobacterium leprae 7935681]